MSTAPTRSLSATGAATATTRCRRPAEALAAPLSAFPSWFLRMECERCGAERYTNQVHMPAAWHDAPVREIVLRLLHERCGGRPKVVELFDTVEGSGRKPRRVS